MSLFFFFAELNYFLHFLTDNLDLFLDADGLNLGVREPQGRSVSLPHPVQTHSCPQAADCEVFLGAGLGAVGGGAWTHTLLLTVCLLVAGLTCWLELTVGPAAQALTRTGNKGKELIKTRHFNAL